MGNKRRKWQPVEIDAAMDLRLQNWGDWRRREDARPRTTCGSVEGRYRPPREFGADVESVARSPWRPIIDEADGALVDRVLRNPWFPVDEFAFLRAHYVLRAPPSLIMRTIGGRRGEYQARLARAVIIARNRMQVVEVRRASSVAGLLPPTLRAPSADAPGVSRRRADDAGLSATRRLVGVDSARAAEQLAQSHDRRFGVDWSRGVESTVMVAGRLEAGVLTIDGWAEFPASGE